MATLNFQSIHDQFRPRVLRYLTRLVGDSEAEDVAQAVMLKVHRLTASFGASVGVSRRLHRTAVRTNELEIRR